MKALTMKARGPASALLALSAVISSSPSVANDEHLLLPPLKTISTIAFTVPGNGDINPYGMAQVKHTTGNLRAGHILVSNFNNSSNLQGTGTTIVDVAPDGSRRHLGDRASGVPDRGGQSGHCRRDILRFVDQRTLGHDGI